MLKVLIVEDEEIIRRGLVYTIDWFSMGCMVVSAAENGKQGLEMMLQYGPDIVLVDILMPEMTGIEMLEAAKNLQIKPFRSIVLTSYASFEYARKAVRLGVSDYLLKPVDEEELERTIAKIRQSIEDTKTVSNVLGVTTNLDAGKLVDWNMYFSGETPKNSYVVQALYKIRDHYADKISIELIAEELDVSTSYLSRKFKEVTSQTFLEILTQYRIQKAIALLKKGTYRVYEVSDMIGFSDYKHFCTVFKRYTKTSPTEFVKNVGRVVNK